VQHKPPEVISPNLPKDSGPQTQPGGLAGENTTGSAHLQCIIFDQLLHLPETRADIFAADDQIDAHIAECEHIE
jgi:hypothetical protein